MHQHEQPLWNVLCYMGYGNHSKGPSLGDQQLHPKPTVNSLVPQLGWKVMLGPLG